MERQCPFCDKPLILSNQIFVCPECRILITDSNIVMEERKRILALRATLREYLRELEQKYIQTPKDLTEHEMEERLFWIEHNKIHEYLEYYEKIAPPNIKSKHYHALLYSYVEIIRNSKELYPCYWS